MTGRRTPHRMSAVSTASTAQPEPGTRVALTALAATFAVNGIVFSSLLPRYPQIAAHVGASSSTFGLALVGGGVGGLVCGVAMPALTRRFGLVRVVRYAGLLLVAGVIGVAVAPSIGLLALAFAVAGGADALHDVSMNEIALGEQSRRPGSIMGRLHGTWSIGATAGGAFGALMAGLGVPVGLHIPAIGVLAAVVQLLSAARLRDRPAEEETPARPPGSPGSGTFRTLSRHWRVLAVLMLAVGAAMLAEITPLDWSALLLRRDLDASAGVAGLGPVVASAGILLARGVIDPAVDRVGAPTVLRWGNALAAVALGLGLLGGGLTGSPLITLAGFAIGGVGVAANFPLMFAGSDRMARDLGLPRGTGTSIVGTLPRVGGLLLPALVAALAGTVGLLWAVGVTVIGALIAAVVLPRVVSAT